jgi:hypothetical protein
VYPLLQSKIARNFLNNIARNDQTPLDRTFYALSNGSMFNNFETPDAWPPFNFLTEKMCQININDWISVSSDCV